MFSSLAYLIESILFPGTSSSSPDKKLVDQENLKALTHLSSSSMSSQESSGRMSTRSSGKAKDDLMKDLFDSEDDEYPIESTTNDASPVFNRPASKDDENPPSPIFNEKLGHSPFRQPSTVKESKVKRSKLFDVDEESHQSTVKESKVKRSALFNFESADESPRTKRPVKERRSGLFGIALDSSDDRLFDDDDDVIENREPPPEASVFRLHPSKKSSTAFTPNTKGRIKEAFKKAFDDSI